LIHTVPASIRLPISAAFAALSFYTVERWALGWRDRAGSKPMAQPAGSRTA
jgi:peptidoglycan/LPS O-acetylase OafA/YrhL